jgi:hypothetical protein
MAELDHEVGNVVHGLLGMARLVRDSGLNAEQENWVRAIEQSGRQLGRLIDAYRRHGSSSERPVVAERSRFDGVELLEQIVISHAPAAASSGNQLLLNVDPQLSRLWRSDPCLLRQVLDNLLANALKFTPSGAIVVEAFPAAADRPANGTLILAVTDNGPGIDDQLGQRMFEPWQQGPGAGGAGSGLGLSICRNIVLAMGGAISWKNPGQGGARFELRLPGVVEPCAAAALPVPRLLRALHCRLRLPDPARRSVALALSRLGVRWSLDEGGRAGRAGNEIVIEQAPAYPGNPGPNLLLRPARAAGSRPRGRRLRAPILECTLGPKLLQMALENLSRGDAGPD